MAVQPWVLTEPTGHSPGSVHCPGAAHLRRGIGMDEHALDIDACHAAHANDVPGGHGGVHLGRRFDAVSAQRPAPSTSDPESTTTPQTRPRTLTTFLMKCEALAMRVGFS